MRKVLILNPKGGSGKSTLATNIGAWYALQDLQPALLDMDPQGSSTRWLGKRSEQRPCVQALRSFDLLGWLEGGSAPLEVVFSTGIFTIVVRAVRLHERRAAGRQGDLGRGLDPYR